MAFLDKLGDLAKNVGEKTGDMVEITKLNSKISSEKSAIEGLKKQIGECCFNKYQEGGIIDEDIVAFCSSIAEHMDTISALQSEIQEIKGKKVEAASPEAPKGNYCPSCGAENAPGCNFCGNCGAKLQ